jgi:hypothetical protein
MEEWNRLYEDVVGSSSSSSSSSSFSEESFNSRLSRMPPLQPHEICTQSASRITDNAIPPHFIVLDVRNCFHPMLMSR